MENVVDSLEPQLEAVARSEGVSPSEVLLAALREHLKAKLPPENCLDIARRLGLVAIHTDAPSDLSTNPIRMEGFGE